MKEQKKENGGVGEGAVGPAASEKYTMVVLQKKDKVLLGLNNLCGNWQFSVQASAR